MRTKQEVLHYPNLKTVLMIEEVLKNSNTLLNREELKKKLPAKVMHQTLNVVLAYLEESGKIIDGRKGIIWIYNPSNKLNNAIRAGAEI